MNKLSQAPQWRYLLRDYLDLYQQGSAGGSAKIRAHQRAVRVALAKVLDGDPDFEPGAPGRLPVCVHLDRALQNAVGQHTATLAASLANVRDALEWRYGYDRVPRGLRQKYAYAEVLGPSGPVVSERLILGVVLFAPSTTYPAHSHKGITESYLCISGHSSENDTGVYAPGSVIFNPPGHTHRITTADREPCLLAYAWVGDEASLLRQKMVFSRSSRTG